ncbi:MAG: Arylsulfate sulfotransferase AssT precursor [Pseudomonadota bacterium]|jgi:hypothetical protein
MSNNNYLNYSLMTLLSLSAAFLNGCSEIPTPLSINVSSITELGFTQMPTLINDPNSATPLVAVVKFSTAKPVKTTLTVIDGSHRRDIYFDKNKNPELGLPIIGLRADHTYSVEVKIDDDNGHQLKADTILSFKTPALPSDLYEFPPLKTTVSKSDKIEPGFTLISVRRRMIGPDTPENRNFTTKFGLLVAIDNEGQVVWYYRSKVRIADFDYLPEKQHFIFLTVDFRAFEMDLLGNQIATWYSTGPKIEREGIPIETMAMHHDIDILPSGNFLTQGTQPKAIDNYYTSETDSKAPRKRQERVIGDELLEFQPDGKVVWRWNVFDYLDPFRLGYGTFDDYWGKRGFPDTVDWTHGNAQLYDSRDNSVIMSLRHQDAIIKVDRQTNQIKWIFSASTRGWSPELKTKLLKFDKNTRPPYHQHGLSLTPQGTLLVFNNGNFQALPFDKPKMPSDIHTQAMEYQIDEKNLTAKEVWASDIAGEPNILSVAMGNTELLPETNHIFVGFGGLLPKNQLQGLTWEKAEHLNQVRWTNLEDFRGWGLIREYTHTKPPRVVWETVMENLSKEVPVEWVLFSAQKISHF